ncbi:MAG: 2-O-(6-phospho-alpha-D-mannosyl)-D-glycerate hydrolase, partial [Acidimicrobiaceae bacterium]|nr:2-O-(6-phospho-alpha-D-mannosyl)-D-glycerate hydrolase [Acidimicrobiaceae bacterium]
MVPHTHWDREWYASFEAFRLRLVDTLDALLAALEEGGSYAHFLFDGQMAMIDDYLEVRPEAEPRLRILAAAGRISLGPWYVLPDELLVSGETLVRNLQLGWQRASHFGPPMPVGYLPDTFGHTAQMPQLLAASGFEHAVVWRGVPSSVTTTAFWWLAPDGSRVRAEYLRHGYGNGAFIPDDAGAFLRRIESHAVELGDALGPDADMLLMAGTDHTVAGPWLGRVAAEVATSSASYDVVVTSLTEHVHGAPVEGLPSIAGELRSGGRADLLIGVASNRIDVKQAAAAAELELERRAEPLAALFLAPESYPQAVLDLAWREMIRNSAHDSICACSADEVVDAVLARYRGATQAGRAVAGAALAALGRSVDGPGTVVVNPSARPRRGIVAVTAPTADLPEVVERTMAARDIGQVLAQIRNQELEPGVYVDAIEVGQLEGDGGLDIVVRAGPVLMPNRSVEETKRDLYTRAGAAPAMPVRLRIERQAAEEILVETPDVPGFGWVTLPAGTAPPSPTSPPVTVEGTTMANGLIRVAVEQNGFRLDGRPGFDRLVDGGDAGDTYNYSPPPGDVLDDEPTATEAIVLEAHPLRARILLRRRYWWCGEVQSIYEIRAGERLVRIETSFENRARDHRLRAHFPLPWPALHSSAESAFAVVERGLEAEGSSHEHPLPTFPSRRFVQAGGLTVVHHGLPEYELIDIDGTGAHGLALTLLRATGMLSKATTAYRTYPAGPLLAVPAAQLQQPLRFCYGVATGEADPYALVDDAFLPLEVVVATQSGGPRPPSGSALTVTGAEVSSLRRVDGALHLRVWNASDQPTVVAIPGRTGLLVDLLGRPLQP